jgi:hypothetical protein
MFDFNVQLNTVNENKTLNEAIEEVFSVNKPTMDLSFFYNEKKDIQKIKEDKTKPPTFTRNKFKLS